MKNINGENNLSVIKELFRVQQVNWSLKHDRFRVCPNNLHPIPDGCIIAIR
jgi:hypothetical protein